jgi:hypothetical protein
MIYNTSYGIASRETALAMMIDGNGETTWNERKLEHLERQAQNEKCGHSDRYILPDGNQLRVSRDLQTALDAAEGLATPV